MPAAIGGALPSLSQIMGWDTEHLVRASADWSATAEHWEDTFESVHRGMLAPYGKARPPTPPRNAPSLIW